MASASIYALASLDLRKLPHKITFISNIHHEAHAFAELTHYAFDAVLISIALAGVKRSTGLTWVESLYSTSNHRASHTAAEIIRSWLNLGEYCFEGAVIMMQRSKSFIRDV
ncbi:hypothetical protein E3P99_01702 [Wallemia hederae]|uniref:DUF1748-domain-containing protein n=1 Tax=Wallemia hederae TaxID=1540922 RepID=A0A4T0FNG0_9BASI|nr:hypothetical protein E3P99_01702 [Wallemia hederae]